MLSANKRLLKTGGPWNPRLGLHARAIDQINIHMSKTPIIHHHKSGTYKTHTYVHMYVHTYIHIWRLPAQLSHGQAASIGTQPSPIKSIWEFQRHTIYLHIYICIVFVLFSYHRSTRCQRQDGRADSRNNSSSLISLHHYMPVPLHHSSSSPSWPSSLSFMAFFFFFFFLFCLFFFLSSWHSSCPSH